MLTAVISSANCDLVIRGVPSVSVDVTERLPALPYANAILPYENEWEFNINELFGHADQFKFTSGVFTNSSDVFFAATKGLVDLQFIPRPNGLTLYRVIIKTDRP